MEKTECVYSSKKRSNYAGTTKTTRNQALLLAGATNMPIVHGLQSDPFFTCFSVVDEAQYISQLDLPGSWVPIAAALLSAQATRNYIQVLRLFIRMFLFTSTSKHPDTLISNTCRVDQTSLPADA